MIGVGAKHDRLIHDIRDWYKNIVENRCSKPGTGNVYSPILDGFYDLPNAVVAYKLEDYCSYSEFVALCKIAGPSGVRVIDIEMVKLAHSELQKIYKVLRDNKDLIQGVEMDIFHPNDRWTSLGKRFKGLNTICRAGVTIGSLIIFRRLLRKALLAVGKRHAPFYANTTEALHDRLYQARVFHEKFSHLSLDVGIVSNYSDSVMRNVFYQLAQEDAKLWNYIPLVFGLCFQDSFWKDTQYNIQLGCLDNNGFTICECVHTLISIFSGAEVGHRQQRLRFIDIAGKNLLYLRKQETGKERSDNTGNLLLVLDHFIRTAPDLTPQDLQHYSIPYDVLRYSLLFFAFFFLFAFYNF